MYCALGGANKTNLLNIKHFFNTSSYFASRFTKSSRTIVNISLIASLALSQSLAAVTLPSGGKFVNGTGSITKPNDKTMNIAGDKTHNVIAWGGGFNIGKGYTVDFTTDKLHYLNLDYTNKASQILGTLNGGTNNIYLVNPSGVLIGEGATINANKFGVSTTPMDINEINDFLNYGSFSPAFNTSKGDVVNMGTINADEIVLVGNKVENIKGTLQSKDQDFADQVTIEGNKVYLEGSRIKATNLDAKIESEGFYRYEAKELDDAVKLNGKLLEGYKFTTKGDFKKYLYIGKESATNNQMIDSWTGFTNLFNEGKLQEWEFNDIYLGKDIDFTGKDAINPIGDKDNPFTANFYGNGHTLSNLQINATSGKKHVGLFGYIKDGGVQDLTINGLEFIISNFELNYEYIGGLAGYIQNGTFSNISLENINIQDFFSSDVLSMGGFAGYIESGTFSNISLNNIAGIGAKDHAGGFAGYIENGEFVNIALDTIGKFEEDGTGTFNNNGDISGGFAGEVNAGNFNNISLSNLGNIEAKDYAGGFAGKINDGIYSNIAIDNIKENSAEGGGFSINAYNFGESYAGGFAGYIKKGDFDNIALSDIKGLIQANKNSGGFAGQIDDGGDFDNIALSDIKSIDGGSNGGGFVGYTAGDGNFNNIVLSRMGSIHGGTTAGGFAGNIYIGDGEYFNIILNNIQDIGGNGSTYSGGFTGYVTDGTFSNIDLSNIVNISSNWAAGGFSGWIDEGVFSNISLNDIDTIKVDAIYAYAGGFSGAIKSGAFSSIILDNIESIVSNNTTKYTGYNSGALAGGFVGYITKGDFDNIILNNIGEISASTKYNDVYTNTGGFVGYIYGGTFKNIVLNNIEDIIGHNYVGGFAGWITSDNDKSFSDVILNNIENISANATNENAYVGGFTGYADAGTYKNIILNDIGEISANSTAKKYIYAGGFAGRVKNDSINFSDIVLNNIRGISASNSTGGFVGNIESGSNITNSNIYFYGSLDSSANENYIIHYENILNLSNSDDLQTLINQSKILDLKYLTDASTGDSYLHRISDDKIGDENSEITFNESDFTYNIPNNTLNIPELNPDNSNSSMPDNSNSLPTVSNEGELSDVVLEKGDFNEGILESILGGTSLEFDLLSGDLESIRQSLDFLTAFLKNENTVNDYFDYIPNDNYDSDVHVKFKDNLQVFIENAIQNEDLNLEFLRDYRASLEKYNNDKKLYESGLLHPELQASLEKDLEKRYAELLGSKDKVDSMLGIFGDYKLILDKDKTIFTGNGSNLKFKVGIGELVNYKNTEGGGENNNNFNPPSDLSKQTELSSKEPILVLPAEETQSVIDEGERELGRVCIVSDNAKTSNPCIAIAF